MSHVIESGAGRLRGRVAMWMLLALAVLLLVPATASARRPRIEAPPTISPDPPVSGKVATADAEWSGGRDAEVAWQWFRCGGTDEESCSAIDGAEESSYRVTSRDVGKRLRVLLYVENDDGSAWALSEPTKQVVEPPKPPPPPEPTPTPTPTPPPSQPAPPPPAPAPVALTPPAPAGTVLPQPTHKKKPRMMRPRPIVRIRGRTTPNGALITLLTVTAPRGAKITVACIGRSCPTRRWAHATKVTRLLRFERVLRAGTKLIIRVTKPRRIGKHTTIVIRRGKAPWRRDRCLNPGAKRPRKCPAV